MSRGVIYYNRGTACIARLIVSLTSLREHYKGPITLVSAGEESFPPLYYISKVFGVDCKSFHSPLDGRRGQIFLETTLAAEYTPYDTTVWIDSDTIVTGKIDELFGLAEENEIAMPQFSTWTMRQRIIRRRIGTWDQFFPERVKKYVGRKDLQSLNCGVYGFVKTSKFMKDWFKYAEPGRRKFIPNEVAMQLSIWEYPHIIADQKFNCSCKYSNPLDPDTRVIHYHGKKHCQMDKEGNVIYHGDLWVERFKKALIEDKANIRSFLPDTLKKDKVLRRFSKYQIKKGDKEWTSLLLPQ